MRPGATISNCTLEGPGAASANSGVDASGAFGRRRSTVSNTVIRGFGHSASAFGAANPATINISYSDYDAAGNQAVGSGSIVTGAGNGFHADAKFLDEAGGDYRPRHDSPLVDAGDPATVGAGSDVRNYQRKVDGNGKGGAVVDIGAYEYPRQAPEPEIDGPTDGAAGVLLSWTGSAQDPDPGETPLVTYSWRIDGGAVKPGATLEHTFTYGGTYMLVLTATDVTGLASTAEFPVVVTGPAPPVPPDPTPPAADPPAGNPPAADPPAPAGDTTPSGGDPAPVLALADLRGPVLGGLRVAKARRASLLVDEQSTLRIAVYRIGRAKPLRTRTRAVTAAGKVLVGLGACAPAATASPRWRPTRRATARATSQAVPPARLDDLVAQLLGHLSGEVARPSRSPARGRSPCRAGSGPPPRARCSRRARGGPSRGPGRSPGPAWRRPRCAGRG